MQNIKLESNSIMWTWQWSLGSSFVIPTIVIIIGVVCLCIKRRNTINVEVITTPDDKTQCIAEPKGYQPTDQNPEPTSYQPPTYLHFFARSLEFKEGEVNKRNC